MARKKRRKAGKRRTKRSTPGWVWMLAGLAVGLGVAVFVYLSGAAPGKTGARPAVLSPQPASALPEAVAPPEPEPVEEPGITFDFYDMLPNLDVEVYEDEARPRRRQAPPPVQVPGVYILQAGSFQKVEDANRRKAEMALLGVRSEIKRGTANNRTVYRVYTEPMEDPDEVNRVSRRLNDAGIEILRKRVSD